MIFFYFIRGRALSLFKNKGIFYAAIKPLYKMFINELAKMWAVHLIYYLQAKSLTKYVITIFFVLIFCRFPHWIFLQSIWLDTQTTFFLWKLDMANVWLFIVK